MIAGATGNTGSVVAESLLARGAPVRIYVRDAAKGEAWRARGAEVVVGRLQDEATLTRALEGTSGAYVIVPPHHGSTSVLADNAALAALWARAVRTAGVPQVVLLSSVGAHLARGTGMIASSRGLERAFAESRAHVTALRAPFFMENWGGSLVGLPQGQLPTFFNADRAMPQVATRDIGTIAASLLLEANEARPNETPRRTVVELAGPRDYSPHDVAEALSKILGRSIAAHQGPIDAMVPILMASGATEDQATLLRDTAIAVNVGVVRGEGGPVVRGVVPIEQVLTSLLAMRA